MTNTMTMIYTNGKSKCVFMPQADMALQHAQWRVNGHGHEIYLTRSVVITLSPLPSWSPP